MNKPPVILGHKDVYFRSTFYSASFINLRVKWAPKYFRRESEKMPTSRVTLLVRLICILTFACFCKCYSPMKRVQISTEELHFSSSSSFRAFGSLFDSKSYLTDLVFGLTTFKALTRNDLSFKRLALNKRATETDKQFLPGVPLIPNFSN